LPKLHNKPTHSKTWSAPTYYLLVSLQDMGILLVTGYFTAQ